MHIPDGVLPGTTCAAAAVVSGAAVAYATVRVREDLGERSAPLLGVLAACVFAIQMLNFPISIGVSGHPLGAMLAAAVVGPWGGIVVMTVVLVVQALVFQDGGLLALGANVLNVAVLGCLVGYAVMDVVRRLLRGRAAVTAGVALGAWCSIFVGAVACSLELATRPDLRLTQVLGPMAVLHAVIGVAEALVTGLAIHYLSVLRPDLVYGTAHSQMRIAVFRVVMVGLGIAAVVVTVLAPFASEWPDALESTLDRVGVLGGEVKPLIPAPMPDYSAGLFENALLGGAVAALSGVVLTFVVAAALAYKSKRGSAPAEATHE